jgi:hypothetical protein
MKQFFTLRNLIVVLSTSLLLSSCSKEDITTPVQKVSTPVSYKDANINISDFKASQVSSADLQVSFSVLYANNVQSIQVLSGATANQLCSFYQVAVAGNSSTPTGFSVDDTNIKGSTMYYMIKFTLTNGNWGYTPVYSLQVKQ